MHLDGQNPSEPAGSAPPAASVVEFVVLVRPWQRADLARSRGPLALPTPSGWLGRPFTVLKLVLDGQSLSKY